MPEQIRVGIIGCGWPGSAHARGYLTASGFKIAAVADLIPDRRKKLMAEFSVQREYSDAKDLLADKELDAVSICLPNHMHAGATLAALRAGKHVLCEKPPAISAAEARRMDAAAKKNGKVLLYSLQRRFGPHEQAARAAIAKGFIGDVYHVRVVWTRTRGIPQGTGWFTQKEKSGGGALMDVGFHMLDLGWHLLGQPKPQSAFGVTHSRFAALVNSNPYDVDDAAFAVIRFEGGRSLELAASWALNQPPQQNGTACRLHGTSGAIEVYTPKGAVLYRDFNEKGECKENPLKPPKTIHHVALVRHFKDCIAGRATPAPGGSEGIALMEMVESIYKSSTSGKSVQI
ncbi:MAG TPA: Gfo/Idh/MocA family oxidoreductase [Tepidisphaeraceae bacterium]|jgi:predicted dehydrogenase|nr:Gfo/Idh/MocA family oxidoreductase [Tepidisphaeraceae bacterium]